MQRKASVHYLARDKVKGVPHHAKAGNINSALMMEGDMQVYIGYMSVNRFWHRATMPMEMNDYLRYQLDGYSGRKKINLGVCFCQGEFVLILDCDMLVHPDFLQRTLGHFYKNEGGSWVKKPKVAFLQTPQDFWNVELSDPMSHCVRFFYGKSTI